MRSLHSRACKGCLKVVPLESCTPSNEYIGVKHGASVALKGHNMQHSCDTGQAKKTLEIQLVRLTEVCGKE